MNSLGAWAAVAGTVIGLALGQVLFKLGAIRVNEQAPAGLIGWFNLPIVAALAIYALSTILWITALRSLPLRIAYPVSAIGFLLVPIFGHLWLDEPLTTRSLAGAAVIIAGIALSTSSN